MGTYTMLREISWAKEAGKRFLYPGYATVEPSHYDYKKLLRPLDYFDWVSSWVRI